MVHKQIVDAWEDAKHGWRDEYAKEFEKSVYLPLIDALKSISDSYADVDEKFENVADVMDFEEFDRKSISVIKNFLHACLECGVPEPGPENVDEVYRILRETLACVRVDLDKYFCGM